jgi:hypothetical protein
MKTSSELVEKVKNHMIKESHNEENDIEDRSRISEDIEELSSFD